MRHRICTLFLAVLALTTTAWPADEADRLQALFDREWEIRVEQNPLFATSVGRHEWNDRLPSMRPEDLERRRDAWQGVLDELAGIDREALDAKARINAQIFRRQLEDRLSDHDFGGYLMPINADTGFHTNLARPGSFSTPHGPFQTPAFMPV